MGLLSNLLNKGHRCLRCGQKSPLTGKGSAWSPIAGTHGAFQCATCGQRVETESHPAAPATPVHPAPSAAPANSGASEPPRPAPVYTPQNSIHLAAEAGDVNLIRTHLAAGESAIAPDPVGLTPMHYAANRDHVEVIRLLLDHGADPNAQGEQGLAPIHGAAYFGQVKTIEFLVDRGANINVRTGAGATPLTIARMRQIQPAIDAIERLGGTA